MLVNQVKVLYLETWGICMKALVICLVGELRNPPKMKVVKICSLGMRNGLEPPPVANHKTWKSREDEVLGWSAYLQELSSWAAQGSVKFGREIEQSSRWLEPIRRSRLSGEQQNRALRLCALLRVAFIDHGRISLMIEGYQEGLDVLPEAMWSDPAETFGNRNGFELLRQLSREFFLRNRAEGLSLKTQLMSRVFSPDVNNGGSHVSDVIRQIDVACARYMRMVGTLPLEFQVGLQIQDSDQLSLLVRSLPNDARSCALMHSPGEIYQQYRMAARRFENQHRLFKDLVPRRGVVNLVEDFQGSGIPNEDTQENEGEGETEYVAGLNQTQGPRCLKCGSKKHDSGSCTTDMSKLRCFKCNQLGHASLNCKVKRTPDGKSNAPKGSGKNSQKGGSSGKGTKGSGKGLRFWMMRGLGGIQMPPVAMKQLDTAQGVLVLNCVLPQNSSVVDVGMPCLLNCCSSDVSLEANEESHAVVTCDCGSDVAGEETNGEKPHFIDVVDMAHDDENSVDMSPIREGCTEIESVYDMDWVEACQSDSWLVETVGCVETCEGDSLLVDCERDALCQGCWGSIPAEECFSTPVAGEVNGISGGDVVQQGHVDFPSSSLMGGDCMNQDLMPCSMLLNSVGLPASDMWLLDSGASVSIVSKDFLKGFQHSVIQTLVNPLQAANGTSVTVDGFCKVLLEIQVVDGKRENNHRNQQCCQSML